MVGRMRAPRARLNARFADSKERLEAAEDAIRRVSERRLAELMKLSERERFEQLDTPDLTPLDRAKLRRSIAVSLRHGKMELILLRGNFRWRRVSRWLRYRGATAIAAAAVAVPLCLLIATAWKNTGEVITVPNAVRLDWRLPSGAVEQTILNVGDRLVIVGQSGKSYVIRRWIKDQGYATSMIEID